MGYSAAGGMTSFKMQASSDDYGTDISAAMDGWPQPSNNSTT